MENRNNAITGKSTIQPKLFVTTDLNNAKSIFVAFDDIIFKFEDLIKAITSCFHIFMVFDLEYPLECRELWEFIQVFFFENYSTTVSTNVSEIIDAIKKTTNH